MANNEHLEILKSGKENWNKWCKTLWVSAYFEDDFGEEFWVKVKSTVDLSNIDLEGMDLRDYDLRMVDFEGSNLSGVNFEGAKLELGLSMYHRVIFSKAFVHIPPGSGRTSFINAKLIGANLKKCNLYHASLAGANFEEANLQGAVLVGASISNTNFSKANLAEVDLDETPIERGNFEEAVLNGATLNGSWISGNFKGADLRSSQLGGKFYQVNFEKANLESAVLSGSGLHESNFVDSYLKQTTLVFDISSPSKNTDKIESGINQVVHIKLVDAYLEKAKIKIRSKEESVEVCGVFNSSNLEKAVIEGGKWVESKFESANLVGCVFANLTLCNSAFNDSKLKGIMFENSTIRNVKFEELDLSGAVFKNTNIDTVNFLGSNLSGSNFCNDIADSSLGDSIKTLFTKVCFRRCDLRKAKMQYSDLSQSDFSFANLTNANLESCNLNDVNFEEADISHANLVMTNMEKAILYKANLTGASIELSNIEKASLLYVNLTQTNLSQRNLSGVNFANSILESVDFTESTLVKANLSNAVINGSRVYGASVWDIKNEGLIQNDLIITGKSEPEITIDNIEVAQFVYLLLNNDKIRDVITTIANKGVLILGRFLSERKEVLDSIRNELRKKDFLPMMFDFEKVESRDYTETIKILAGISRFVIVDVTQQSSCPLELQAIVPDYRIPYLPIILKGQKPFSMLSDLIRKYEWVSRVLEYENVSELIKNFDIGIIDEMEKMENRLKISERKSIIRDL